MKNMIIAVLICLPLGCASISEQAKMEAYDRTMDAYQTTMRLSDYAALGGHMDHVVRVDDVLKPEIRSVPQHAGAPDPQARHHFRWSGKERT